MGYFDAFHVGTMSVSLAVRLSSPPLRALACCIIVIIAGKAALRTKARPLYLRVQEVTNAALAVLIAWCASYYMTVPTLAGPLSSLRSLEPASEPSTDLTYTCPSQMDQSACLNANHTAKRRSSASRCKCRLATETTAMQARRPCLS